MTGDMEAMFLVRGAKFPEINREITELRRHYRAWAMETSDPPPPAFNEAFPELDRIFQAIVQLHLIRERKVYEGVIRESQDRRHNSS